VAPAGVFGSAMLEVALGLIFLYFILSTVASSINELIATAMKWRAGTLESALANLINDPHLLRQVLDHPLIRSMGQNASEQRGKQRTHPDPNKTRLEGRPSYIPSRTFALAVMHSLSNPDATVANIQGDGSINMTRIRATAQALAQAGNTESKQLTGEVMQALLEECRDPDGAAQALDRVKQRLDDGLKSSASMPSLDQWRNSLRSAIDVAALRRVISDLPDADQKWANSIVDAGVHEIDIATYKIDRLRTSLEAWFDHAMDRAAGVYKRNALKVLAVIAVIITLASGADSVNFVSRLYVDSALRSQLAQQAAPSSQQLDLSNAVKSLEPFATLFGYGDYPANNSGLPNWLLLKAAGEIITVFAILLGAPFWFDLLTKLVNMRGTGPKPASTTKSTSSSA
jgi:hypothetical protein